MVGGKKMYVISEESGQTKSLYLKDLYLKDRKAGLIMKAVSIWAALE